MSKCGNCGIEFQTRKEQITHMIDVHKSPYLDGDEKDVKLSNSYLAKRAGEGDEKAIKMKAFVDEELKEVF
jgi:transcription elongation factor Elf1